MTTYVDGNCTVKEARDEGLEEPLAKHTGLSVRTVRDKLQNAHGATRIKNVFDWPLRVDELGAWTVAFAIERDVAAELSEIIELGHRAVKARLHDAAGNTLVRNLFRDRWPQADLLAMTVAAVLEGDCIGELADLVGLAPRTVRRRLEEAHGRTLVRSLFTSETDEVRSDATACRSAALAGVLGVPRLDVARPEAPPATLEAGGRTAPNSSEEHPSTETRSDMFRRYDLQRARATRARREPAVHQAEALAKLDEWYRSRPTGDRGGILALPTGGGKTFTTVRFLCQEPLSDDGYKVLWLAHTHHLLEQAIDSFGKLDAGPNEPVEVAHVAEPRTHLDVRVVSATPGHFPVAKISPSDDVVIATLQTISAAYERKHDRLLKFLEAADGKLVVVFDEAHHAPAPSYRRLLERLRKAHPQMYLLGLTATPTYSDERRQGWLKALFPQDILFSVSRSRLIALRVLAKPHFEDARTEIAVELDEATYQRWLSSYGDLPEEVISRLAENQQRNDFIVNTYLHDKDRYGKTLVFADRWYQCDYLREALRRHGVRADVVYSHVNAPLHTVEQRNQRTKDENARVLEQFRRGELDVLINVRMLTEGTDVPSVKTVFLTRQTTSSILLTQMIGRALRGPHFGGTDDAFIVSFIDNWKQVISFADYEALPAGQVDDGVAEYGKRPPLQIISIELVRRLARQMHKGGGATASFITLLPVGWYRVEFQTRSGEGDDIMWARHLVMVFANEKARYDGFIGSVGEREWTDYASESLTLVDVQSELEAWRDQYFAVADDHPGNDLLRDLFYILRHMAQNAGSAPVFFRFEERDAHDLDALARVFIQRDLGPRKLDEALTLEYQRLDRFWRSIYPSYRLFCAQYQATQQRQLDAARHGIPVERFQGIVETPERLPLREPSELVKQAVFRRDGNKCCCCGATLDLQVDHIVPAYLGGSSDMDQLQTLCRTCNNHKGISEVNFRISRPPLERPPALTDLELPDHDDPTSDQTWSSFVRRTINFFYQCAAVDTLEWASADVQPQEAVARLKLGVDPGWFEPHVPNLESRIAAMRLGSGLPPLRKLRLVATT